MTEPEHYLHVVRTTKDVCPDLVDAHAFGPHRSACSRHARHWAFRDAEGAGLFSIYEARGEFRRGKP